MANGAGFHLLVFGVLCGVYAFKYGCVDVGVQAILKAVPIWYLAFALARGVTERHCGRSCPKAESLGFYATQGLLLSSIGDLFLEQMAIAERLGVPEDLLFVLGLGAFLIAHLLYVVASTAHTEPSDKSHTATVSLLGTYCAAFVSMLWPNLDKPLRLPVAVYAVVLASMVYFATLRHTSHDQPAKKKTAMLGVRQ
mmetsp:Transcript_14962/g.45183  ORF Transcript_14962/g.45183 Transcript_14962/m.45183 type:complete len:196 (-) Transcript_14962:564-1151(-)